MAESTGGKTKKPPRIQKPVGGPKAPKTPAQARARAKKAVQFSEGIDIAHEIICGATLGELEKRTGMSKKTLMARVHAFEVLSPDSYRRMADGLRTWIANLAMDDVLHWRPIGRNAEDIEDRKLGLANYKQSTDVLIKAFGLQSQSIELSSDSRQTPHTMEEITDYIASRPEMAAAVEEMHRLAAEKAAAK